MGNKVKCEVCSRQTAGFCSFKKTKVKLTKKRVCDKFKYDAGKEKEKQPIETIRRPDWYWDKEKKKKAMKEELKRLQELEKERIEAEKKGKKIVDANDIQMIKPRDLKYPLTGDLSRFTTTADKKNKE
jgi:hypothetical protein